MFDNRRRVEVVVRRRPNWFLLLFFIYLIVMVVGFMFPEYWRTHPASTAVVVQPHPSAVRP
jgi:hypothetical protein